MLNEEMINHLIIEMIEKKVDEKVNEITDKIIAEKVQTEIIQRLNNIFNVETSRYVDPYKIAERVVRENIEKAIPNIMSKDFLDKVTSEISRNIAFKLHQDIVESIGISLLHTNDEEEYY